MCVCTLLYRKIQNCKEYSETYDLSQSQFYRIVGKNIPGRNIAGPECVQEQMAYYRKRLTPMNTITLTTLSYWLTMTAKYRKMR
jgi:hypothetical protein